MARITDNIARRLPPTGLSVEAPRSSYWVGASREELAAIVAQRRSVMASPDPHDAIYGPFRCRGESPMTAYRNRQRAARWARRDGR